MILSILEVEGDVGSDVRQFRIAPFGSDKVLGKFVAAFPCEDVHAATQVASAFLVASGIMSASSIHLSDEAIEVLTQAAPAE